LWGEHAIWEGATPEEQDELLAMEMPIVEATVAAYPWDEVKISARHFEEQLTSFGTVDMNAEAWTLEQFRTVMPRDERAYVASREYRQEEHAEFFTSMQYYVVEGALVAMVVFGVMLRRRWTRELAALVVMVAIVVVVNAAITGVLSNVED